MVISDVKNFLVEIRRYNPKAKIIWTWGMIPLDIIPAYIKEGIFEYKKDFKDDDVYTLELDSMETLEKNEEDKGSRGHPGPLTHRKAAEKIAAFIKQNL